MLLARPDKHHSSVAWNRDRDGAHQSYGTVHADCNTKLTLHKQVAHYAKLSLSFVSTVSCSKPRRAGPVGCRGHRWGASRHRARAALGTERQVLLCCRAQLAKMNLHMHDLRRESGEAAKFEQDLAELRKNLQQGPQRGPQADPLARPPPSPARCAPRGRPGRASAGVEGTRQAGRALARRACLACSSAATAWSFEPFTRVQRRCQLVAHGCKSSVQFLRCSHRQIPSLLRSQC